MLGIPRGLSKRGIVILDKWHHHHRSPLHILKRSHSISGKGPAFDALGVGLARLCFGVAMDRHDLGL